MTDIDTHEMLFDMPPTEVTLEERVWAGMATDAEKVQFEMNQYTESDRRAAAAEFYTRLLSKIPDAYRNPFVTNALRDGIETTLALKPLPPEQGEQ